MNQLLTHSERSAYVLGSEVDAESSDLIFVADLASSAVFCFSGSAATIWLLLEEPITVENLVHQIALKFGEDVKTVEEGTVSFVDDLLRLHLISTSDR